MSLTKKLAALIMLVSSCVAFPAYANEHVPTVRTSLSRSELLDALREGHLKVFGKYPTKNRLAMAWGQVAFENGGGKWSFNHNLGNVAAAKQDQPTYFNKGDKHWYRSFVDFEDGAAGYWDVIKHCQPALAAFDWGNPQLAAVRLKNCNYFEATLDEYTPGFSSLYFTAINKLIPEEEREQTRRDQELLAAIKRSIDEGSAATPAADPSGTLVVDSLWSTDY